MATQGPQAQSPAPEYLTIAQAAVLLQKSRLTLYRNCAKGLIPGAKKIGGNWRISAAVLAAAFETPTRSPDTVKAILHAMPAAVEY